MAAVRCCARIAAVWFLRAAMAERSAPTIPRWCFTVRRERFLATSSVIPFLCMRRYTWVQAILRGFLRCKKSDSFLEVAKRKIFGAWGEEMEGKGTGRRHGPCCPPARKGGPCWGRYGSRRMSRFRASTLHKVPSAFNVQQRMYICDVPSEQRGPSERAKSESVQTSQTRRAIIRHPLSHPAIHPPKVSKLAQYAYQHAPRSLLHPTTRSTSFPEAKQTYSP